MNILKQLADNFKTRYLENYHEHERKNIYINKEHTIAITDNPRKPAIQAKYQIDLINEAMDLLNIAGGESIFLDVAMDEEHDTFVLLLQRGDMQVMISPWIHIEEDED